MTKKFLMISEAQIRSAVNPDTVSQAKKIQEILGDISLNEAITLVESSVADRKITQADYNEWLRQIVLQAEFLRDEGQQVSLNKRRQFDDVFNEVVENDPAGKINPGDIGTFVAVSNILWGMYKQSKDHVRVNKAMAAREEEEAVYGGRDGEFGIGADEDDTSEVSAPSAYDTTDSYDADEDLDAVPSSSEDDDGVECPYDEDTPEYDAWMAGFAAARGEENDVDTNANADEEPMTDEYDDADQTGAMDSRVGQGDEAVRGEGEPVDKGSFEDEEEDEYTQGYRAAKREYRTGIKAAPRNASPRWELGYEDFMKDTEGQRGLATHEVEDEERAKAVPAKKVPTLRDVLSGNGDVMKQEVKRLEREGADAFRAMTLPSNPHPHGSLAKKAWARGFKNAAKSSFGFFDKPVVKPTAGKKKK